MLAAWVWPLAVCAGDMGVGLTGCELGWRKGTLTPLSLSTHLQLVSTAVHPRGAAREWAQSAGCWGLELCGSYATVQYNFLLIWALSVFIPVL